MALKYSLNEWPPPRETLAYGLQWFMVAVPLIIILGRVAAALHYPQEPALQLAYLQRLFLVSGVVFLGQLTLGHKLPITVGPASVLLAGIIVNAATARTEAVYLSIAIGGAAYALLAAVGLLSRIGAFFTKKIIGVVLLLIAFTMLPTILNLLTGGQEPSFARLFFSAGLFAAMLLGQRWLPDLLRSTILVWALVVGSAAYHLLYAPALPAVTTDAFFSWEGLAGPSLSGGIDIGVTISFLFCFLALVANDVGSIQTTAQVVAADDNGARTKAGLTVTGIGNLLAGLFGVIGPVNYSISTGVILSSGCASRQTLIPGAVGVTALAFTPQIIQAFSVVPTPVVGTLLLYLMSSQASAGLSLLAESLAGYTYEEGLVIAVPILLGTMIAFLPAAAAASIPPLLRPLLANGFVVGTTAALILERIFARPK